MNRRTFMQKLTYGFGTAFALSNTNASGTVFGREKLSKIGLQLYTVRKDLERDFEGTLRQVAALGINEVEFAGYFEQKPERKKIACKS